MLNVVWWSVTHENKRFAIHCVGDPQLEVSSIFEEAQRV